ncbi:deoxyribose-phosphate aldolase [Enterococcus sp. BWB1-3]|uniref:deoxyribose-phosphate aldolase n=1 Tax=unclassified Enterococcus TaxID=2608891 RepID=UPI00192490D4|nr:MULTISPECIES: deoxyribose-phosphate aldolase [unclassified Enterococcus]MBL1228095.1 deoxyribose-phosphate aldolase [Enterococcus sp. BWB1-3]MCB5951920.1 deoxyribose-phosphate aldolase [Enterococcus sp. BWT-B8]MCB5954116.1 deoxyribose-phosphate aldolase [Enterococcus sp. CWB-B31]
MGIDLKQLSVLLLDSSMTDQQLKEDILFIREFGIKAVIVLPCQITRTKQLLEGTTIQVGSIADYPLGAGTLGKQAFETGEIYRNGAAEVYITATLENLPISKQTFQMLEPLSFGKGQLGFFIDIDEMPEEDRSRIAFQIGRVNVKEILLGTGISVEDALFHLGIFRTARERQLRVQVNVNSPTLLEIEILLQSGADVIGINNAREVLPLLKKK